MDIKKALEVSTKKLKQAKIASARLDSEILLACALGKTREFLIAHDDQQLKNYENSKFESFIARRLDREPVCYITNQLEFYGLDFFVDKRVLSPRVETELIAELAIKNAPSNSSLIDIGTGSGALAISIAKYRPDLAITATEVSSEAMQVAQFNNKKLLAGECKINFIMANVWQGVEGIFETIVTNLPYVSLDYQPNMKPEVLKEPTIALYGGKGDGLDLYRKFYQGISKHLAPSGIVYHESDPWQHQALSELALSAGLEPILEKYLILGFRKK